MEIPYLLQQYRPRDDLALVANRGSKSILRPQRLTARGYQVEFEIPDTQHHFFDDTIAAPGESLNTGPAIP
jgi:hypothetical protein